MTIPEREDRIQLLKDKHLEKLSKLAEVLEGNQEISKLHEELISFHKTGVDLFNEFDRTLDEYSLTKYEITDDIAIRKSEDALNFVDTIINHWITVRLFCDKFQLDVPIPSVTSYATLQRVIKRFFPNEVEQVKLKFERHKLPVYGFATAEEHSGWKLKESIRKIPTIIGILFILCSGIIAFVFPTLTGNQYLFFRLLLSTGFMFIIYEFCDGLLKLKISKGKKFALSATGGIALFVLIYYVNPPLAP